MNPVPPIQLSRWLGNIPATPRAVQYIAPPITNDTILHLPSALTPRISPWDNPIKAHDRLL